MKENTESVARRRLFADGRSTVAPVHYTAVEPIHPSFMFPRERVAALEAETNPRTETETEADALSRISRSMR